MTTYAKIGDLNIDLDVPKFHTLSGTLLRLERHAAMNVENSIYVKAGDTFEIAAGLSFIVCENHENGQGRGSAFCAIDPVILTGPAIIEMTQVNNKVHSALKNEPKESWSFDLDLIGLSFITGIFAVLFFFLMILIFADPANLQHNKPLFDKGYALIWTIFSVIIFAGINKLTVSGKNVRRDAIQNALITSYTIWSPDDLIAIIEKRTHRKADAV